MTKASHDSPCRHLFEKLSEYLDRELDESVCRHIEAHLADCPQCRGYMETLQKTVALCRQLKAREVPESFSRRLQESIREAIGQAAPPEPGPA